MEHKKGMYCVVYQFWLLSTKDSKMWIARLGFVAFLH